MKFSVKKNEFTDGFLFKKDQNERWFGGLDSYDVLNS